MGKPSKRRTQKAMARRKAKHKSLQRLPGRFPAVPPDAPIHECLVPRSLYELGLGNVLVARELPSGLIAMVSFLLDVYCLGVKDVAYGVSGLSEYRERTCFMAGGSFETLSPATARALVEGAVAYARQFDLPSHADYEVACRIFAGVDSSAADRVFSYGKDGKPLYVAGPRDTLVKSKRVIAALERVCGLGGFDYLVAVGAEEEG